MAEQPTQPVDPVQPVPPPPPASPVIKKAETMNFPDALRKVKDGKKITKLEWKGNGDYVLFKDDWLMIYRKENDKFHTFIIKGADLFGEDFIVID